MNLENILDIIAVIIFVFINFVLWIKPKWYFSFIDYVLNSSPIQSEELRKNPIISKFFFWCARIVFLFTLVMILVVYVF